MEGKQNITISVPPQLALLIAAYSTTAVGSLMALSLGMAYVAAGHGAWLMTFLGLAPPKGPNWFMAVYFSLVTMVLLAVFLRLLWWHHQVRQTLTSTAPSGDSIFPKRLEKEYKQDTIEDIEERLRSGQVKGDELRGLIAHGILRPVRRIRKV